MLELGVDAAPLRRFAASGGGRLWVQTRDRFANARSTKCMPPLWCELR